MGCAKIGIQTSWSGDAKNNSVRCVQVRVWRDSEYDRVIGCGKTARPGLRGGRGLVTESPTVRDHQFQEGLMVYPASRHAQG